MRMRNDNMCDGLARLEGIENGFNMIIEQRSRVNHSNLACANNISACSCEGKSAWVIGDDATNARAHVSHFAIGEVHFSFEWYCGHVKLLTGLYAQTLAQYGLNA